MHSENAQVYTVVFFIALKVGVKCVRPTLEMGVRKEEQRGTVRFLVAEGTGTREIDRRTSALCGEHCMSLTSVHE